MEWNDKMQMAELLNNGKYAEAVEFIKDKDIDAQAMEMFIYGFYLNQCVLLEPIRSLILSYNTEVLDYPASFRVEIAKLELLTSL